MPSVCRGRHRAAEMVRWVLSPSMGSVSSAQAPCGSAVSLPACNAVMGEANRLEYVYTTGRIPRPLSIMVQKHHNTEAIHQINLSCNFMGWGVILMSRWWDRTKRSGLTERMSWKSHHLRVQPWLYGASWHVKRPLSNIWRGEDADEDEDFRWLELLVVPHNY